MKCEWCDDKIKDYAFTIDLGRTGDFHFCSEDCRDSFINDSLCITEFDEELEALEEAYYDC